MDTAELENLLSGAVETDSLEFKQAMAWDRKVFVKDILAMANIVDGGRIVVGIEDETLIRQGLTAGQAATFDFQTMRDQIAPFADPRVVFRSELVTDSGGLTFAVIEIEPFDDVPVVCKRNGEDVKAGEIYYRSRVRRPQSARIDNSADMRDVLERSAAHLMGRFRRLGFDAPDDAQAQFDEELGDL
jgi:predicted HTH transcriptional regulator